MARYEIVGLYDCPWFAKAEKLLEEIQIQFPIVEFRKSMKDRFQWNDFVAKMRLTRGWNLKRSPVIYEVLVDPKGKAVLIGDIDDFCEYVLAFYGIVSDCKESAALQDQVVMNRALFAKGFEGQDRGTKSICNLVILNGPLQLVEDLVLGLLSPLSILPPSILFNIKVYDERSGVKELEGLCMEAADLASANLFQISVSSTLRELFYDAHLVLVLEDMTIRPEEDTKDWLERVQWAVLRYAEPMNQVAGDNCRLLIGGEGPQCYIAEMFRKMLKGKKVRSGHIVTVGQHVITRAKAMIGPRAGVPGGTISRLHAWGWPGMTGAFVEVRDAIYKDGSGSIQGPPPSEIPLAEIALDPNWLFNAFSDDFLFSQQERIQKTSYFPPGHRCMAEAVLTTLHIWLMSSSAFGPLPGFNKEQICCQACPFPSPIATPTSAVSSESAKPPKQPLTPPSRSDTEDLVLPVISAGVQCSKKSSFPQGTFMVQPAVCYFGKWVPAGQVSPGSHERVLREVNRLWEVRQALIFRDLDIRGEFPDYDLLTSAPGNEEEDEGEAEAGTLQAGPDLDTN